MKKGWLMSIRSKNKSNKKEQLDALEKQIDQCRILYELYFSGIEKREPMWHRQEIVRVFTTFQRGSKGTAVERFRLRSLRARWNSLSQKWDRINLQREKGTYYKDKARARRRFNIEQKNLQTSAPGYPTDDLSDTDEHPTVYSLQDLEKPDLGESERKASQVAAAAAAAANEKSSRNVGRLTEERCQKIYRTYLAAKKKCGESVDKVSYNSMVNSIRKQVPRLKEKGYRDIDFKVVIRGGKAALKPVGKKSE